MNSNVDRTPNLTKAYNRIASTRAEIAIGLALAESCRDLIVADLRDMAHEYGLTFADEIEPEPMPLIEPETVVKVRGKAVKVGSKPDKVEQLSMFDSALNPVVETVQFDGSNWDEYLNDLFARLDGNGNLSDDVADLMVDDSAEVADSTVYGFGALQKATIAMIFVFFVILISVL